ncbi:hypothetical protein FQR65_LT04686 [Abscondita terminalis]|nr:hypothetical protein FQR65_LT04686 [Abscondita terminalis]
MFRKYTLTQYKHHYNKLITLKKQKLPEVKNEIDNLSSRCLNIIEHTKQKTFACNQWISQLLRVTSCSFSRVNKCEKEVQHPLVVKKCIKGLGRLKNFHVKGVQNFTLNRNILAAALISSKTIPSEDVPLIIEPIPEPPPILETDLAAEVASQLNALGEPTLSSLGLAAWTPVGLIQSCLEFFHVSFGLPWWGSIALGTVIVRLLMFPLVIIAQRNGAKMNNYMPQLQAIQLKMTEARQTGNQLDAARYSQEMVIFLKEKNLNPLKNMIVPLAQMPLFISFFIGLRKMANLPVESLRDGGMLWFNDLTVPDEYFILPIITSATLWITIEVSWYRHCKLSSQNLQTMKYVLRALPVLIFPFTMNFPGAILCYWVSSNFISLAQVGFLRIPSVRDYFKIEALVKHDPTNLPIKSKGFVEGLKDTWTNSKITRELEERRRFDELQFKRAGSGPVIKTYKYDPTQQTNPNAINAKKR